MSSALDSSFAIRRCPRCTFTLVPHPVGAVELDACPRCHGAFVEQHEGAHVLGPFGDVASWPQGAARLLGESQLRCPIDDAPLQAWRVEVPAGAAIEAASIEVDTCPSCRGLWLDAHEAEQLQRVGQKPASSALNSPPPGHEKTGVGWYLFQLFTTMPLEVYNPKRNKAVVCMGLIAVCVVVFGLELLASAMGHTELVMRFGAAGNDLAHGRNLHAIITHMFLHGGVAHLLGNMWMLWLFGDNIEDRVGRRAFLLLYLAFGIGGLALQILLGVDPSVPLVGASGAIAGLMGAYLGLFPRARIYQVFFFIRWKLPTWFYVGGWAALNVIIGWAELNHAIPDVHVAWWAHVGGFVFGLAWALLFGRSKYADGAELTHA